MLSRLMAYARGLLSRDRALREADDELRFHFDREIEANLSRGRGGSRPPSTARRVHRRAAPGHNL